MMLIRATPRNNTPPWCWIESMRSATSQPTGNNYKQTAVSWTIFNKFWLLQVQVKNAYFLSYYYFFTFQNRITNCYPQSNNLKSQIDAHLWGYHFFNFDLVYTELHHGLCYVSWGKSLKSSEQTNWKEFEGGWNPGGKGYQIATVG